MNLKQRLIQKAQELDFTDVGFTTAEPLDLYLKELESREEFYFWALTDMFDLRRGAGLREKHPWAKSVVVLLSNYHRRRFPPQLTGKIGRCYQVDDRQEKREEYQRITVFFNFLKQEGLQYQFDQETPARMTAAKAGLVTYGKNCFVYSRRAMLGASWLVSIPILLDKEIEPDEPSIELGCPKWCKNACIAACPTGALFAPKKMNPLKCIAFNSYYAPGITPLELREPMGAWVYGCDRCQEVCPRNQAWMNQALPENPSLFERADDFRIETLLAMSQEHYENKVWPLAFYIPKENIAKWKMNAARALGNLGDPAHVPALIRAFDENSDETVRGMCAWALGKLGGKQAKDALEARRPKEDGLVAEEIAAALAAIN
ncbi:MAG: epoxyqueuosine reductase [Candidatus Abyssobacteria bacterium SURF_5]|uniref:Epoxyqueuosine reductase n=1 Tax=Abyssobacteria bacterium (strain SURF_5) TaxID=2093360 RepID=A0A3A4NVL3_ABYX5|nr:MAG: epoxyqueuosine reductase [Candidatus Abyssubacteria bacterium SURF_5]